jgi:hypothetical protein
MTDNITTELDEVAKRRELQLILLREGYSQEDAHQQATGCPVDELDEWIEKMCDHAMHFPERQILPPGTADMVDAKSQRREALNEVELDQYFAKRDRTAELMIQSFSAYEMPTAVLQALIDALEEVGVDRQDAVAKIAKASCATTEYPDEIPTSAVLRGVRRPRVPRTSEARRHHDHALRGLPSQGPRPAIPRPRRQDRGRSSQEEGQGTSRRPPRDGLLGPQQGREDQGSPGRGPDDSPDLRGYGFSAQYRGQDRPQKDGCLTPIFEVNLRLC